MKTLNLKFWGQTKAWWVVLIVGILLVIGGFCYWFWPVSGYAIASQIFGWLLVLAGIVQLCVGAGPNANRGSGWGWWIAGGIIDMFIGFLMVRSIVVSEIIFPYFLAFIFIFWGISAIVSACNNTAARYWWLYLINGILLLFVGFLFIESGWVGDMMMTSFLTAIAFIYWGFTIAMVSLDMKPTRLVP